MKTNEQRMNEEKKEYRKAMVEHGGQILGQLLCFVFTSQAKDRHFLKVLYSEL